MFTRPHITAEQKFPHSQLVTILVHISRASEMSVLLTLQAGSLFRAAPAAWCKMKEPATPGFREFVIVPVLNSYRLFRGFD